MPHPAHPSRRQPLTPPTDPTGQPDHPGDGATPSPAATKTTWTDAEWSELLERSQRGDAAALRELRQAMSRYPDLERQYGDLAQIIRQHTVDAILGRDNLLLRDALDRQLAALRHELEPIARSPLERLLVERVLTCWLALQVAELTASAPPPSTFRERRLDRAHHRYLASIQALARVSRLLAPTIAQINIAASGAQQLNVAPQPASPDP